MQTTNTTFNPTKNITCFDLENSTWDNLYYHALNIGLCAMQMEILKEQFENSQVKKSTLQQVFIKRVYADGDCIFLGTTINTPSEIAPFIDYHLDTIAPINYPLTLGKEIIESITFQSSFNFNEATFNVLEKVNENNNSGLLFAFQHDFINLDLSHLSLSLFDIERKLNIELTFCDELKSTVSNSLTLHHLYFKNRVPVAFGFKQNKSSIEYIAWSKEFIQSILDIHPINENAINKEETLNVVLDKINANGFEQLTDVQKEFLASF
jgi:hypothetical protein